MLFSLEDIVINTDRREVFRGGAEVTMQPQVFDLIVCLIVHRDQVVSRDDLLELVWKGRLVSDSTLASRINAARRALGDNGASQRVIRTVSRRGFCFVGDVVETPAREAAGSNMQGSLPTIAVLPLVDLSAKSVRDSFADALTGDIIAALSAWQTFPVVARSSTFAYKGVSTDVRDVASKLGARYVLGGSVRETGHLLRVVVELIDAATGLHLWTEKFDRELSDDFHLQDEITQRIVTNLKPQLRKWEQKLSLSEARGEPNAWDYYQLGWSQLDEDTLQGNARAREMFQYSVAIDPTYAHAVSSISIAYQRDLLLGDTTSQEQKIFKAVEAAERAVSIDTSSSRLRATFGHSLRLAGRFDDALSQFETAISLDPNNAIAIAGFGLTLVVTGQTDKGVETIRRVAELGLNDEWVTSKLAFGLVTAGDYEPAAVAARKAINDRPRRPGAYLLLAIALAHLGQVEGARGVLSDCERVCPGFVDRWQPGFRIKQANQRMQDGLRLVGWAG